MFDFSFSKVLLLGTGGGSDILSASLVGFYLQKQGINVDVAGMLSPVAYHIFNGKPEEVVNPILGDCRRYFGNGKQISFIDSMLPALIPEIPHFYDLSSRSGTAPMLSGIEQLVKTNGYDAVIGVDVGGDVLGRRSDTSLLSPAMDFTSLYLLGRLSVPTYLIEFGLQTDGELSPRSVYELLKEIPLISTGTISYADAQIQRFEEIFSHVSQYRTGNTVPRTLRTLQETEDIHCDHNRDYKIGTQIFANSFPIVLENQYFGKTFLIDAKQLAHQRQDTAFGYVDPIYQYLTLKQFPPWRNEMDFGFHRIGDEILYCMCIPSTVAPQTEMVYAGIGLAPAVLMYARHVPKGVPALEFQQFAIVGERRKEAWQAISNL